MNWWPYPAYSQWGSASSASSQPTDVMSIPALTSLNAVVGVTTDTASSLPALAVTPTSSTDTATSTTQPAATSSASMITITALPPAASPGRQYNRPSASSFNIIYLSPLFALAGAIAGAIVAWLLLRLIRRRRNIRASKLKAGPAYAPTQSSDDHSNAESLSEPTRSFLGRRGVIQPSTRGSLLSKASSKRSNWLVRALSSHRRELAAAHDDHVPSDPEVGHDSVAQQEDDPFLVPSTVTTPSRARSVANAARPSPSRFREILRSPEVLSEDEELDSAPWDTLRHKSIRRGILERLQDGPQPRRGHQRSDSDVTVEALRGEQSKYLMVPPLTGASASRGRSSTGGRSGSEVLTPPGSSGPGFRIVEEDPENDASSSIFSGGWRSPWTSTSGKRAEDHLTALPLRRSSPDKRRSPSVASYSVDLQSTPSKTRYPVEKFPFKRVDSAVLPSSPPLVSSPPLEAQLFFRSISPGFEAAPNLELGAPSSSQDTDTESGDRATGRKHNKLHTHRSPPVLPYPSSPQYARTPKRLTKSAAHSTSPDKARSARATPARAQSPAERFNRRHGALDKVNQILAESWSARDLRGEAVNSPTLFGAVP